VSLGLLAAQSLGHWLRAYERGVQQVHCSGARQLRRGPRQKDRPVTSLRHQWGEEFLRKAQFFLLCAIVSNFV